MKENASEISEDDYVEEEDKKRDREENIVASVPTKCVHLILLVVFFLS